MNLMSETGLGVYNKFIENVNKEKNNHLSLLALRKMALVRIKRSYGDAGLDRVLESFIEHRPHWNEPRIAAGIKDSFEACLYFVAHMEVGFGGYTFRTAVQRRPAALANDFVVTTVNSRGKRVVNILNKISPETERKSFCRIHPKKKTAVRDLCATCYARVRGLVGSSMVDETTSQETLIEILSIENVRGSKLFFAEARYLLMARLELESE